MPRQDRNPCSGCGRLLQDEIAERRGCWSDEGGVPADAADGPVGVTAMTGRHVVGDGRVLAVAAPIAVHGDALALDENLDGAAGEAYLDLGAGEAVGNAVGRPRNTLAAGIQPTAIGGTQRPSQSKALKR